MKSSLKETVMLKVDPKRPAKGDLIYSAKIIRSGALVAFPTDTVYGLAANLLDKKAVSRLYKAKERPRNKPFTVHVANKNDIKRLGCRITKDAKALIDKFWPGPLTIILKSKTGRSVGFRMPANRLALEVIKRARVPVVLPSANLNGMPPPKNAVEVLKDLGGRIDLILDGGRTDIGIESTVIDLTVTPPKILRQGAIKKKALLKVLKF